MLQATLICRPLGILPLSRQVLTNARWLYPLIWFVFIFLYICRIASGVLSPGSGGVSSEWMSSPPMGSSGGGGVSVSTGGVNGVVELLLLEPVDSWASGGAGSMG